MPIYEYKCLSCGNLFEELVKLNETPDCPSCKSSDLERLVSTPAVSTAKTRERSADAGRRTAQRLRTDKQQAQAAYERNYIKDHSD